MKGLYEFKFNSMAHAIKITAGDIAEIIEKIKDNA